MKSSINNIEFLNKLAQAASKKTEPAQTVLEAGSLLKSFLKIDRADFIIWDNSMLRLKNISKGAYTDITSGINFIYNSLAMSKGGKFYFNDEEFDCSIKDDEYRIDDLKSGNNNIIFPLALNGEVFGLMNLYTERKDFNSEFFMVLNTASKLISGAVINYILNEQMEAGVNFYRAMKDIAKIIESQYELNYIIPLIGEMIDRFMPKHLIYIFIYKDNKFSLVWPKACKDEKVYKLLKQVNPDTEYLLSSDNKTGIFPIVNDGNILGAAAAYSNIDMLQQKDIDYLIQLTKQSGMTIQRANVYAEVLKYAALDALTGLNNRRQFEIRIKQEIAKSKRNGTPLCCIMLDADYFKKINDTWGHAAGDKVLKTLADVIMQEIREYDTAFRYGGEEFFIILPQTKLPEAASAAERLRKAVQKTKIEINGLKKSEKMYINVTISLGVCGYDNSMDAEDLILKTDKALYEAKETGRNRVIAAS